MRYQDQLAEAAAATELGGGPSYRWLGVELPVAADDVWRTASADDRRVILARALRDRLYASFYLRGHAAPIDRATFADPRSERAQLHALSAANAGRGYWDDGWLVRETAGDEVVIEKDGLRARAAAGSCDAPPVVGATVAVRHPKEFQRLYAGFYMATGDAGAPVPPLLRVYWNAAACATDLVAQLAGSLNAELVRFRLKIALGQAAAVRADNAVLYVGRADFGRIAPALRVVAGELGSALGPAVPALTKPLVPGVSLAEDPGGDESFGQHRCRLIAEGLLDAKDSDERAASVLRRFHREGIDPDLPYLAPGSCDRYELPA